MVMSRLANLHLFRRAVFAFAESLPLSKAAQKALWAEAVIKEIVNKPAA